MIILGQLYDSAEHHLGSGKLDWASFCDSFSSIFCAGFSVYTTTFSETGIRKKTESIASTNQPVLIQYVELKLPDQHPISETELPTFEPIRRTDVYGDQDFEELGALSEFLIKNDLYYLLMVHAELAPGSYIGLFLWRGQAEGDFSDLEKQRLALFMRHLLAIVDVENRLPAKSASAILQFGERNGLTNSETDILALLLRGKSLKEIAKESDRAYGTVRWHVQNILEKCQVDTQKKLLGEFYSLIDS